MEAHQLALGIEWHAVCPSCPSEGLVKQEVTGWPVTTIVRGKIVVDCELVGSLQRGPQ
jgi:hypothetical protein